MADFMVNGRRFAAVDDKTMETAMQAPDFEWYYAKDSAVPHLSSAHAMLRLLMFEQLWQDAEFAAFVQKTYQVAYLLPEDHKSGVVVVVRRDGEKKPAEKEALGEVVPLFSVEDQGLDP